jgi:hypothetical protein
MAIQVFIYGGVGPLHSDVTSSGVAKAFGVRLVRCLISSDFFNPKLLISLLDMSVSSSSSFFFLSFFLLFVSVPIQAPANSIH